MDILARIRFCATGPALETLHSQGVAFTYQITGNKHVGIDQPLGPRPCKEDMEHSKNITY